MIRRLQKSNKILKLRKNPFQKLNRQQVNNKLRKPQPSSKIPKKLNCTKKAMKKIKIK